MGERGPHWMLETTLGGMVHLSWMKLLIFAASCHRFSKRKLRFRTRLDFKQTKRKRCCSSARVELRTTRLLQFVPAVRVRAANFAGKSDKGHLVCDVAAGSSCVEVGRELRVLEGPANNPMSVPGIRFKYFVPPTTLRQYRTWRSERLGPYCRLKGVAGSGHRVA
eukprot:1977476-Rhodomonas_salina.1